MEIIPLLHSRFNFAVLWLILSGIQIQPISVGGLPDSLGNLILSQPNAREAVTSIIVYSMLWMDSTSQTFFIASGIIQCTIMAVWLCSSAPCNLPNCTSFNSICRSKLYRVKMIFLVATFELPLLCSGPWYGTSFTRCTLLAPRAALHVPVQFPSITYLF